MEENNYGNNSIVQYLMGASRIRYSVLDDFGLSNIKPNHIVLFIDLHNVLYRLFRNRDYAAIEHVPFEVIVKDLTVGMLNIAAHYRRYFYTRLNRSNDILFFFNRKLPDYQKKYYPEFNHKLYARYDTSHKDFSVLAQALIEALKFAKSMVPYFTGVYFIDNTGVDDFAAMKLFMDEPDYADAYQIILTKNMYAAQLLQPNRVILFNARSKSYIIDHHSAYTKGVINNRKMTVSDRLIPEYLPLLWMVCGCADVNMKHTDYCRRIVDMCHFADDLKKAGKLIPNTSPEYFLQLLETDCDMKGITDDAEELLNRYKALNINLAEKAISINQIKRFQEGLIELYDQSSLETLNENLSRISPDTELIEINSLNMARVNRPGAGDYNDIFNYSF